MTTIFRNGRFVSHEWNCDTGTHVDELIDTFDLARYWGEPLESFNGTLGELLTFLKKNDVEGVSLIEHLTRSNIEPFLEEPLLGEVKDDDPLDFLQIKRWVTIEREKDGELVLENHVDLTGKKHDNPDNYGVEFAPLCELAHLPLIVESKATLTDNTADYSTSTRFVTSSITLGEFFQAVFDEVSFCGSPAQRDVERNSLVDAVADCRKDLNEEQP